ncbi:hypothetical protein DV515_00002391 [Chloebia gouldiae]|uniref:Uncharacterized protein n=1 Tax=Chloebia gouldiae TaxID=44316 RepID=A0A3L8SVH7_CHLGU|nr:hypothetical protein DV515_00002391 [Chloebia gouldiae]
MQEEVLALKEAIDRSGIQAEIGCRKRCQPTVHILQGDTPCPQPILTVHGVALVGEQLCQRPECILFIQVEPLPHIFLHSPSSSSRHPAEVTRPGLAPEAGSLCTHVGTSAGRKTCASLFNQAQISPKDSQQDLEAVQPNTPLLLLNMKAAEAIATSWCEKDATSMMTELAALTFSSKAVRVGSSCSLEKHTRGSVKDMAFKSRHAKQPQSAGPAQNRRQAGAAWRSIHCKSPNLGKNLKAEKMVAGSGKDGDGKWLHQPWGVTTVLLLGRAETVLCTTRAVRTPSCHSPLVKSPLAHPHCPSFTWLLSSTLVLRQVRAQRRQPEYQMAGPKPKKGTEVQSVSKRRGEAQQLLDDEELQVSCGNLFAHLSQRQHLQSIKEVNMGRTTSGATVQSRYQHRAGNCCSSDPNSRQDWKNLRYEYTELKRAHSSPRSFKDATVEPRQVMSEPILELPPPATYNKVVDNACKQICQENTAFGFA